MKYNTDNIDAIAQYYNLDKNETMYFLRELESIEAKMYEIPYKEIKYPQLLFVDTSDDSFAEILTYKKYTKVGQAKILSNYGQDAPRIDLYGQDFQTKVKPIGASFGYSRQDIRIASAKGRGLSTEGAKTTKEAVERKLNEIAFLGDASCGINGLLNYPGITQYITPNGAGGFPQFNKKTPDEIIKDLLGIVNAIMSSTNAVEVPDTLLLPIDQYNYIANVRMTDGSDTTILSFFKKNNPYIKYVDYLSELKGIGTGGSDRMFVYNRSADKQVFKIPLPFELLQPQAKGYEYIVNTETRAGGVVVRFPMSQAYADNI